LINEKHDVFIEFHPLMSFHHPNDTLKFYYNERRKILDNNGYKQNKLYVIQIIEELKKIIKNVKK